MDEGKDVGRERNKETEHYKHYSHSSVLRKIEITKSIRQQ